MQEQAASSSSRGSAQRVLCVGYDSQLLERRAAVLPRVGYDVVCVGDFAEARARLATDSFDAIVFGHAVPKPDWETLVRDVRTRNPQTKVVLLYADSTPRTEYADATLPVQSGAEALAHTLRQLLRSA